MLAISFAQPDLPATGALGLFCGEDEELQGLARAADEAIGGAISRALKVAEFSGKKGQSCTILAPGGGLERVVVVGLGKASELDQSRAEEAGGALAVAFGKDAEVTVAADALSAARIADVAFGAVLRAYNFGLYRTREAEDKPRLSSLTLLTADDGVTAAWSDRRAVAHGVFIARDLVSEPPNVLFPAEMADRIVKLGGLGLTVEVLGQQELEALGFGMVLGVSQGSARAPRVVVMQWRGLDAAFDSDEGRPLAFIGKGVTFDTGGISIKPAAGMEDMKWDMAGSGAVVGLMAALAGRRARVNAVGLVGLVENMPSATAMRPGDVVTSYSGQTVEVLNTDAEGRLVLGDVLWYAQQKFDPRFMIDLATLTGAIIVSLGHEHAGLFSNDDALSAQLLSAGVATGERVWRMPLGEAYDKQIRSDIADIKNIGAGRAGGSITAAQFLQRFTNGKPWAHLDIAGTAWATKDGPITPKGATAFGVRLLDQMVRDAFEA